MAKAIENLFIYLSAGSDILILLLYLANFRKIKQERKLWLIPIYCASALLINLVTADFISRKYEYIYYAIYTLFEYFVFAYFFYQSIRNVKFRRVMIWLSLGFVLFSFCYYRYFYQWRQGNVDTVSIAIETILIMLYSFWYLYEQTNNSNTLFIYNKYEFWVVTGLLIYLAGSFFIYISANILVTRGKGIGYYWYLTNVFYIIKNIFFGIALYHLVRKQSKSPAPSQKLHPSFP